MEVFYLIICGIVLKLICRSIMVQVLIDKSRPIPKTSESLQTFLTYDFKFSMRIQITEDEQKVADFVKKAMTEKSMRWILPMTASKAKRWRFPNPMI